LPSTRRSCSADFRKGMIEKRLRRVRSIILILSGKGGVGKSVISAALAEILAQAGLKVGLLDADVYGPSSALIFGVHDFPKEKANGLVPPSRSGVKLMSVDLFASGRPVPITGLATVQVLTEVLALTDWGELDYLLVDMPPSTGDIMMFLTSLEKRKTSALVVSMPDRLSTGVASRVLTLLRSERFRVIGILGNMVRKAPSLSEGASSLETLASASRAPLLGVLPFDEGAAAAVERGDIDGLVRTRFSAQLRRSVKRHIDQS